MKLEKAYLSICEPPSPATKPPAMSSLHGTKVDFLFNPKEYTVKKSAKWERKAGKGSKKASMPEFMGPEPRTLDVECFLDRSDSADGDVTKEVEALFGCLAPTDSTRSSNKPSPPWVIFGWGSTITIAGVVKSVTAKYTMFRPDGKPVRASCSLSIEEMPTEPAKQNPTSGGLAARRTHRLVDGESLASVAFEEYGDPALWRAVAAANGIDDPQRVPAGTELLVPTAREAAELTGVPAGAVR